MVGTLNFGRYGHGAVFDGERFIVIGGADYLKSEWCTLQDKNITCEAQPAYLSYVRYTPEIFLVDDTYGDDCN